MNQQVVVAGAIQQAVVEETQRHQHLWHPHRCCSAPSPCRIPVHAGHASVCVSAHSVGASGVGSPSDGVKPRPGPWCLSADDCCTVILDLLQCVASQRDSNELPKPHHPYRGQYAAHWVNGRRCSGGTSLLSGSKHRRSSASRQGSQLAAVCLLPPATQILRRCCWHATQMAIQMTTQMLTQTLHLGPEHARIVWGLETCRFGRQGWGGEVERTPGGVFLGM